MCTNPGLKTSFIVFDWMKNIPTKHDDWNVDCDLSEWFVLVTFKGLPEVDLIRNNRNLVSVDKVQDFFHVALRKHCSHWVCWVNDKHELRLLIHKCLSILQINLKVLIFPELIWNSLDSHGRTNIREEGVPHLRYQNLISRVYECH